MAADRPTEDWTGPTIGFLKAGLRWDAERGMWDHMFSSAYQMACGALVALGQANEQRGGATPRADPQLPDPLPRWDDVCAAMLALAYQCGDIGFYLPNQWLLTRTACYQPTDHGPWPIPKPNIRPAHGLGYAHASEDLVPALRALGLVEGDHWTLAAEPGLFRDQPPGWGVEPANDARFSAAVDRAATNMPDDIKATFDQLATVTTADLEKAVEDSRRFAAEEIVRKARIAANKGAAIETLTNNGASVEPISARLRPLSEKEIAQARRSVESMRHWQLDWLFFRRWRLEDGWLDPTQAEQALGIFHDSLAIAVRQAVAARCYPDRPFLAVH